MNFKGVVKAVMPIKQITTRDNKQLLMREAVVETIEQYPQSIVFNVSGDDVNKDFLAVGQKVEVELNARATEWQGRWFNNLRAWKIVKLE